MPKLNPNEAPEGYVAVKHDQINCVGCYFRWHKDSCVPRPCAGPDRKDGAWVIFRPKPTKPASKPREWMAWLTQLHDGDHALDGSLHKRRAAAREWAQGTKIIKVKITEVV